ncbi:Alpha beta-hydrolase [Mycena kentingensis (nom. inval.)]|nr:Alpha beta-hydrolase [Mycena kentingensis (nom. inval.)]
MTYQLPSRSPFGYSSSSYGNSSPVDNRAPSDRGWGDDQYRRESSEQWRDQSERRQDDHQPHPRDPSRPHAQSQAGSKRKGMDLPVKSASSQGRPLRRVVAGFGDFSKIILRAMELEKNPYDSPEAIEAMFWDEHWSEEDKDKFLDEKRAAERNYEANLLLHQKLPDLSRKRAQLNGDELNAWLHQVQKGANTALSEDFKKMTELVGKLVNRDIERNARDICALDHSPAETLIDENGQEVRVKARPKGIDEDTRVGRGTNNDITGGLLAPIGLDWKDPRVRQDIREKKIDLADNYYASVFYAGFKGSMNDVEAGFLRSRYLLEGAVVVIDSSIDVSDDEADENRRPAKKARKSRKVSRKSVAELADLNGKVTGRLIAYIAVVLYASLTTMSVWDDNWPVISLPQMYDFIVDYFEEPAEGTEARKRADELLSWWNRKLFKNHTSSSRTYNPSVNSRTALRAQRRAREPVQ